MTSRKTKTPRPRLAAPVGPAGAPLTASEFKATVAADPDLQTVTLDEVAATYGVGKRSLLRYVATGELNATRFGRKYVVTITALRAFLASNRTTQPSAPVVRRSRNE